MVSSRMKRSSACSASGPPRRMKRSSCPGMGMRPFSALAVALAQHLDGERQSLVEDEREGMRRIDGDRRQDREHVGEEQPLQPAALAGLQVARLEDVHAGCADLGLQRAPAGLLVGDEAGGKAVDGAQLLGRRQAVLRLRLHAGRHLAVNAGDAHHVEFVEVGGRDRQEAQALEQRVALVLRLFEHAAIELQPGQLAIVEPGRPLGRRLDRLGTCHGLLAHLVPRTRHFSIYP